MPLGHLGINVRSLDVSRHYYDALLPLLGYESFLVHDDEFAYRPSGGKVGTYLFFYPADRATQLYDETAIGLQHLAFMVATRSDVDAAYTSACDLGSTSVHPPQSWPQYPPPYYAAFWRDPDGIMLEAVCHKDR